MAEVSLAHAPSAGAIIASRQDASGLGEAAEIKLQVCKQQLADVKGQAAELSKDNVALASEVMQLRALLAKEKENGCALGNRIDHLQVRPSWLSTHTERSLHA
jgi:hypothetical protein